MYDVHLHRKKIDDDDDDEEMKKKKKKIVVVNFDFTSNIWKITYNVWSI